MSISSNVRLLFCLSVLGMCMLTGSAGASVSADFVGAPTSGTVPLTVQFTDLSTGSPTSWNWDFGDGTSTAMGQWTQLPDAPWSGRSSHTSVVMPDGSIVLMGGFDRTTYYRINDVWQSTDNGATWTLMTENAPWSGRSSHTSVVMPDGSIVLMGGVGTGGIYFSDVWRSTDNGATWTLMTENAPWNKRLYHTSVALPDGSIVLMGGNVMTPYVSYIMNDVWRSTDNGATWTLMTENAPWSARVLHTSVVMPDGSIVLMGGGSSHYGDAVMKNDVWRSMDKGATWTLITENAPWIKRVTHSSVALPDGSIVLMGGRIYSSIIMNDVWRSTDNGASWTQLPDAGWLGRQDYTSVALPDSSIVVLGGHTPYSVIWNDVWRSIPAGSLEQNPSHTYTKTGTYTVALTAFNYEGSNTATKLHYITVNDANTAPVLVPIGDQAVDEGVQLQFTVAASDPEGDILTYSTSELPAGAAFDAGTRTFSWTPGFTQAGSYPVTFTVSDGTLTDTEEVMITVNNVNRAPVLEAIGDQTVDEGAQLRFSVSASDPDGSTLTYSTSLLPVGAAFDEGTRTFTWTPGFAQAGSYPVTFTVSDGTLTDMEEVTIFVNNVNRAPVFDLIGSKIVDEAVQLQFTVAASDPEGDILTYSTSELPAGAAFDAGTRTFSWTPTLSQAGSYDVTFTVSDGQLSASEKVAITVINVNKNPIAEAGTSQAVLVSEPATFDGSQSVDPDGSIASYAWNFGDGSSGSGVAPKHSFGTSGTFTVTLTVTDNEGATATDTTTVTVRSPRDSIREVIIYIKSLSLPKGTENSLVVKLENAIKSLDKGNVDAAKSQIDATINETAAQKDKKLPGDPAITIITRLRNISLYL